MPEPTEPKKETVRIAVTPPRPPSGKPAAGRETVRINLPSRPPTSSPLPPSSPPVAGVARPPVAKPLIPPAPERPIQPPKFVPPPVSAVPKAASPAAAPMPAPSAVPGPKKETARITVLPDPQPAHPSVQMKKTQPLFTMPAPSVPVPVTPVTVTEQEPEPAPGDLPMAFYWGVVTVSAVVLLIQILNYIS